MAHYTIRPYVTLRVLWCFDYWSHCIDFNVWIKPSSVVSCGECHGVKELAPRKMTVNSKWKLMLIENKMEVVISIDQNLQRTWRTKYQRPTRTAENGRNIWWVMCDLSVTFINFLWCQDVVWKFLGVTCNERYIVTTKID